MAFERPPYVPPWAEPVERSSAVVQKREHRAHPDSADQATELIREAGLGPRRLAVMVFLTTLRRNPRDPRRAYQAARFAVTLAKRSISTEREG